VVLDGFVRELADVSVSRWGVDAQGDTPVRGDFDGDGVVDPTVFRPGAATWFILKSASHYADWQWFGWGIASDTLVPADYDAIESPMRRCIGRQRESGTSGRRQGRPRGT